MGESISTIQRSPLISTSYKFAAPRYRLPPMALQTVQVSVEPRLSTALNWRSLSRAVKESQSLCPSPLPRFQQHCLSTSRRDACERISAIQAVLKGRTMAIRKGNKHQLGLFFLLEACQRNAAGWSTAVWPANAKLPLPHRRSSITRPCCSIERSSAQLLVFTCTSKFERSTGSSESDAVDALGLCAVEVIICMITRDFSVISMTSQASLSLSLSLSQKSLTHNIGSASALPIIPQAQPHAQSLFLFPIVFGINNYGLNKFSNNLRPDPLRLF